MARNVTLQCDICGQPTKMIVGKIMFIPQDGRRRSAHSDYSHSADVGECCKAKLFNTVRFQRRRTFRQYQEDRRGSQVA